MVINPLESAHPTGMAVAGEAVKALLAGLGAAQTPAWVSETFRFLNDRVPSGVLQMFSRLALVQMLPLLLPRDAHLIFTSHHAPLWRTGRHTLVVHDVISLEFPFQHRPQTLYFLFLLPRLIAAAARVVFISHSVETLVRRHLEIEDQGKVWVIPSYNERIATYQPSPVNLTARVAARRFFIIGARFRHKNLGLVLRAAKRLMDQGETGFSIRVMGCTDALWASGGLEELKRAGIVETVGYASPADLDQLYREATAFLYVSMAEGQGLPPLEAMANGCPVIASDIPVLRETCGDGAFFVDGNDPEPLAALLADILRGTKSEDLAARQAAGFQRAKDFSREKITARWEEFVAALPGKAAQLTRGS